MAERFKCRRLGCGRDFSAEDPTDECRYHSGEPFFHDAIKGWNCCQQKSTDFQTFLDFKGCKTGSHSTEEPIRRSIPTEERATAPPVPETPNQDNEDTQWRALAIREAPSVARALSTTAERPVVTCRRCRKGKAASRDEECRFHSGATIFHETLKYWSCCPQRKFTDFADFEAFGGCETAAEHDFAEPRAEPRVDWFQTANDVTIIWYGLKGARALTSRVESDGREVRAQLADAEGNALYGREWRLWAGVRQRESQVVLEATRAELRLRKSRANEQWFGFESK